MREASAAASQPATHRHPPWGEPKGAQQRRSARWPTMTVRRIAGRASPAIGRSALVHSAAVMPCVPRLEGESMVDQLGCQVGLHPRGYLGVKIAAVFMAAILTMSLASRFARAFELRVTDVTFDQTAQIFIRDCARRTIRSSPTNPTAGTGPSKATTSPGHPRQRPHRPQRRDLHRDHRHEPRPNSPATSTSLVKFSTAATESSPSAAPPSQMRWPPYC